MTGAGGVNGIAYYNEIDPYAAQWLRNLIAGGHIAPGDVDERSIVDLRPGDLAGYTQCHFFAGIGGWSVALRLAGWPDDRPVWTGSCPCQPFSSAGAGKAADDERHLWPRWLPLIAERRPPIVLGEQVEAAIGWGWLDAVFADLEGEGYACGATILPACGVGAPHIRQRCWFVADAVRGRAGAGPEPSTAHQDASGARRGWDAEPRHGSELCGSGKLADTQSERRQRLSDSGREEIPDSARGGQAGDVADTARGGQREFGDASRPGRGGHADSGLLAGELGNTLGARLEGLAGNGDNGSQSGWQRADADGPTSAAGPHGDVADTAEQGWSARAQRTTGEDGRPAEEPRRLRDSGFWAGCDWLPCTDGKARPVRPGSFPLAHGIQQRTSKLRAYGNAIVPQVAAEFIAAYLDCEPVRAA